MDKKLFGFIGLTSVACIACCALPILSIAGLGVGLTTLCNGSLPYILLGTTLILAIVIFQIRKKASVSCSATSCDNNCSCKSK